MRTLVLAGLLAIAFHHTALNALAQSEAGAGSAAGAGTPPPADTGSNGSSRDEDAEAALAALATQPQLPTLRGGTLGIPAAPKSEGLQAMVSTQALTGGSQDLPGTIDFDLFTRLGGLRLFDSFAIDILAESYKQSLPHVDLMERPVMPRMVLSELRDIGFRLRWSTARNGKTDQILIRAREATKDGESIKASVVGQSLFNREFTVTAGARFLQRTDPERSFLDFNGAAAEAIVQYSFRRVRDNFDCKRRQLKESAEVLEREEVDVEKRLKEDMSRTEREQLEIMASRLKSARSSITAVPLEHSTSDTDAGLNSAAQTLGQLVEDPMNPAGPSTRNAADPTPTTSTARTTSAAKKAKDKVENAREGCKTGGYGVTLFAGLSATMLHTETSRDEMRNVEDPLFKEARFTIGGDIQSSFTGRGTTLLPRMGVYATFSRGVWDNRFAPSGVESDTHAFQFEGGLYVSGHLISGFDVLVSFVALKPYGDRSTEFLVNLAPAIGASLGGKP